MEIEIRLKIDHARSYDFLALHSKLDKSKGQKNIRLDLLLKSSLYYAKLKILLEMVRFKTFIWNVDQTR